MAMHTKISALDVVNEAAHALTGDPADFDPLMDMIGDARFVLIGEASHGTHEFYRVRAELTQRLIEEKGFHAVAAEADWPDAYRVNRYVQNQGRDHQPEAALSDFQRFPTWMWRNEDVRDFVQWLHDRNKPHRTPGKVGFYGLDLYSLYESMAKVIEYLEQVDPEGARRARDRYSCFEQFMDEPQRYGYATRFNMGVDCEDAVINQLMELRQNAQNYLQRDGFIAEDELFFAEQNARLVRNAEQYYRGMFGGRVSTWNMRDEHMAQTLEALNQHLTRLTGEPARIVVWEHNSHIGDARATYMGKRGEHNVGQLAREAYGTDQVRLIGFTTDHGTVTAASDWGEPMERKRVRRALDGSFEKLFHEADHEDFMLILRGDQRLSEALRAERLERAIGVIYRPETERASHYFECRLSDQFDAVLHYDKTRALTPLVPDSGWDEGELPETYPHGV